METWKAIPGWAARYEASSAGQIRSLDMLCPGRSQKPTLRKGRTLKHVVKGGRYRCVTLTDAAGNRRQTFVHGSIALTFIGTKPKGSLTRHLDDNRANNTATNLAYGTRLDNAADAQRNGRVARGDRHGCAQLSEEAVRAIRESKDASSDLAARHSVTKTHVWAVRSRRVWRHM
jgi:hypothetical protein